MERRVSHRACGHRARERWRNHRPETRLTPEAYTQTVDSWQNPNEDSHGVDISQIRSQLRMSVEERVNHMVVVANTFRKIRESAQIVDRPIGR